MMEYVRKQRAVCVSIQAKDCAAFCGNLKEILRGFAGSTKLRTVSFPRSFILRFNVQPFNILASFNLAIVSQSIHNLSRSPFTI